MISKRIFDYIIAQNEKRQKKILSKLLVSTFNTLKAFREKLDTKPFEDKLNKFLNSLVPERERIYTYENKLNELLELYKLDDELFFIKEKVEEKQLIVNELIKRLEEEICPPKTKK